MGVLRSRPRLRGFGAGGADGRTSAAPTLGQNNTFQMDQSDDVGHQGILAPGIHRALQRGDVTADTGKTELQDRVQNRLPFPPRRFCSVPEFFNSSGVKRQSPFLSFAG